MISYHYFGGIFISELKALVISDIHLGYEQSLRNAGNFLPNLQIEELKKRLESMILKFKPQKIIICGDVKHNFSKNTIQELVELKNFFTFFEKLGLKLILIEGNHDKFLKTITSKHGFQVYEFYEEGKYVFVHGDKDFPLEKGKTLIMGHEHPAISLKDEIGVNHTFKCFLEIESNYSKIIVLPAFSTLFPGSDVMRQNHFMSPILRKLEGNKIIPRVIDEIEKVRVFPELNKLY